MYISQCISCSERKIHSIIFILHAHTCAHSNIYIVWQLQETGHHHSSLIPVSTLPIRGSSGKFIDWTSLTSGFSIYFYIFISLWAFQLCLYIRSVSDLEKFSPINVFFSIYCVPLGAGRSWLSTIFWPLLAVLFFAIFSNSCSISHLDKLVG